MAAFYQEVPPSHETSWMAAKGDKLVEDPEGPIDLASTQTDVPNTISGTVWLETGGPDKGIVATGPSFNGVDEAADGYTVYASTLTKDGAAANQKLHEQYKDDPNQLADATKKMLEDHPEYILKTVYGKTNNKGEYTLRFGAYEKGQDREDILNPNHVFVWVENKDGVVQNGYTGFHTPVFQRFNDGGNFRASAIPGENQLPIDFTGVPFQNLNSLYNVNYAVMPYTPVSITADYNATDKPAAPGATVTPEFNGDLSTLPSKVEWRDQKGDVKKTCELDQSKGIKAQVKACTFDIPKDAKKGDYFNVVLVSGGNDVSAWTVLVTNDADELTPAYEEKLVVPGEETKSSPTFTKTGEDQEGNPTEETVDAPEGSKFAIPEDYKAPEGYAVEIDKNTGEITVTFPDKSKLNKDTTEEFDVPVTVTYPDGSKDDATAKFKLDTDGDGTPDVTDTDDDDDGIDDKDDSNPKVPNQNLSYEPEYKGGEGKPGGEAKVDKPEFKDKDGKPTTAPDGTKFTPGENVPEGYVVKVEENTGEITVNIPDTAKPGDEVKIPVVVTYPDGTKDNVDVTVTVTDKDKDLYEPSYEDKLVVPGKETKSSPTFTDKDGKDATAPEGSKFKITDGFTTPEGYEVSIDENTGEVTVTFPDKSKLNKETTEEFDVPVTVTYPDKSTDEAKAKFKLDTDGDGTPDLTDTDDDGDGIPDDQDSNPKVPNANDHFDPNYEDGSGKPGEDVKVPAPTFKDKEGNPTTAPDGTKFTPGDKVPEGVTVNEDGSVTVKVPEDAKPGDKITVPVVVTYPDGSKDTVDVTVTVEKPDAPVTPAEKDNEKFNPGYEDGSGKPGEDVKVPAPTFKDKEGNPTTAPDGTKFTPGDKVPEGVTVNEDGSVTVKVPEDAKPGDKITVPVVVTYPDGSKDTVDVTVTVEKPDAPVTPAEKDNEKFNPGYEDGSGKPGDDVKVPAPTFKDKEGNPTTAPDGTKFTPGDKVPEGVTVNEDGSVTVKVPEDAKPGDKITVPVVVTYPDGSKDNVDVTVTVEKPDAPVTPAEKDNEKFNPEYEDGKGNPGGEVKVPAPTFKDKEGNPTTAPDGTKFTPGDKVPEGVTVNEDGSVTVKVPEDAKPGDKITVPVVVTYPDGSKDNVDVTVTVEKPTDTEPSDPSTGPEKPNEDPSHGNDLDSLQPGYDETHVQPGATKSATPAFTDKGGKKVTDLKGIKVQDNPEAKGYPKAEGATDWKFTPKGATVTGQAPSVEQLVKQFNGLYGEKGNRKKVDFKQFEEDFGKVAKPAVIFDLSDGKTTKENQQAQFVLVGQDGKSILDPNGDFDGDGVTNENEVKNGWNPFDKSDNGRDTGKCVASAVGFGLPLIALLPLGLASQIQIPVLSDVAAQVDAQLQAVNTRIQQQAGIFNPEMARQAEQINAQLRAVGGDLGMVAAGIVLIAAGILAGTVIYDNCNPNGPKSSVKDLELKGSSGKTTKLSSKQDKNVSTSTPKAPETDTPQA
ncbi:YPDG domain-containing protein [Corynebacterium pseudogenitalium]|uniref:YPDG domain-containing protein n=1 Tax=Corynebacterium pseudogenitalium TaxID=38303 RepID=A0ABD4TSX0_9CORY|nr:YPDG domain-containing protein [Corynebacterium pseudogenitalium]MCQ4614364.1 YPDG domain-containing protein [Corynebacterium pseudogenitalium]